MDSRLPPVTQLMPLTDIAFVVCTALDSRGTRAVLSGGGAATYYAPQAYQSQDLDFVIEFYGGRGDQEALAEVGFLPEVRSHYRHHASPITLDFPEGLLAVGDETIETWDTVERGGLLLHIITPTDSVRDRLAAFLHWGDRASLETALAVARAQRQRIDLKLIEDWSRREGGEAKFEEFKRKLGSNPGSADPTSSTKTPICFNSRG